jgi:hypothetical protein
MNVGLLLKILFLFKSLKFFDCFAMELVRKHCDRSMEVGTVMMGKKVEYMTDEPYKIKVYDSYSQELINNETKISPDSSLIVNIEPKIFQMVISSNHDNAFFEDGSCNGTRTNKNGSKLVINKSSKTNIISISGVWAKSYSDGVKACSNYILYLEYDNSDNQAEL